MHGHLNVTLPEDGNSAEKCREQISSKIHNI